MKVPAVARNRHPELQIGQAGHIGRATAPLLLGVCLAISARFANYSLPIEQVFVIFNAQIAPEKCHQVPHESVRRLPAWPKSLAIPWLCRLAG